MTKNQQLDLLFDEWENSNPLYKGKFVRDGILNEALFEKQKIKILFLCKEPNNPRQSSEDFRVNFGGGSFSPSFSFSISEWAYGLLNNFPDYDYINNKKRREALRCIAFMNLKKIGGKSVSFRKEIEQHIIEDRSYLQRQIEIINPDLIIGSVTHYRSWQLLFEAHEYSKSGYGIKLLKWQHYPIIDFYHPSARGGRASYYALLKLVFESNFRIGN